METYLYKGRNKRGELMQGSIDAPSSQSVASWLSASGIAPIQIRIDNTGDDAGQKDIFGRSGKASLNQADLIMFTRQMLTLTKSGVPLLTGLASIQLAVSKPAVRDVVREIRAELDKGLELNQAMARQPEFFDDYYVSMIRVGEMSGTLEEVLLRLLEQIDFDRIIKQKIKSALRYPSFVVIALAIAIALMTTFVIPVFAKTYSKFNAQLPYLTQLLLDVSDFARGYWWLIIGAAVAAYAVFKAYVKTPDGHYAWDRFKLRLPIIGKIISKASIARFCRSLATATKSGMPIVQALTLVSRVVDNKYYEERILLIRNGVERGESLKRVSQTAGIFNALEIQMISIGEEAGDIDGMLFQVANIYQEEVEYEINRLTESIEPILLGMMGILVAILMLGIFLPMWKLSQVALQHH